MSESKAQVKIIEVETLFIGGGPATLGVLSNAYQTDRIRDLVDPQDPLKTRRGIAIVELSSTFGGGNLQKVTGITSNTSASGFLKIIMYPKTESIIVSPVKSSEKLKRSPSRDKSAKNAFKVNNSEVNTKR